MPTIFRSGPYRVFFYSNEGNPREAIHVHVMAGGREAKIWVQPDVSVASSHGFNARELNAIIQIVDEHHEKIEQAWYEHFGH